MVRVVAHERGQIEGNREPAAPVFEQIFVALVGFLRRSEAGELPHCEKFPAVSRGVNATRVGRLARIAKIIFFAPIGGQVGLRIQPANGHAGNRGEAGVTVLVEIHAAWRANRPLGSFFERRRERLLGPFLLGVGRMAVFKHVRDWTLGNLRFQRLLFHSNPGVLVSMIGKWRRGSKARARCQNDRSVCKFVLSQNVIFELVRYSSELVRYLSASRTPIFCISSGDHSASFSFCRSFNSFAAWSYRASNSRGSSMQSMSTLRPNRFSTMTDIL